MSKVIATQKDNQKVAKPGLVLAASAGTETAPIGATALRRVAEKIIALSKTSGAHSFDLGCTLAEAKSLVPEKAFGKWLSTFSDYTVRSAWNYISIHERLQEYREQLLSHAVMPTVMFELAKGDPAQIEMVVARIADGERIRVKDVREMLGTKPKSKSDVAVFDAAGVAGLRKVAAAKIDEDAARFLELILTNVEKSLKPLADKKPVVKKTLQEKVVHDCRHAHDLLNSVAAPLVPDATAYMNWRAAKLPEGTVWRSVQDLLHRMGGADNWPERAAFVPWLQNEVVPLLRFVVHGEAVAGKRDTDEADDTDFEDLIPFDQMPGKIQATVENALEIVSPENRDKIRSIITFNPNSSKRLHKKLAA